MAASGCICTPGGVSDSTCMVTPFSSMSASRYSVMSGSRFIHCAATSGLKGMAPFSAVPWVTRPGSITASSMAMILMRDLGSGPPSSAWATPVPITVDAPSAAAPVPAAVFRTCRLVHW
ncbi:hypothetical protein GCM10020295_03650 [Streptomyces cinereospinus]